MLLRVRDRDIVEIDSARGTIEEHEPGIGSSHREISIDRTDRGSIEPGLCMPRTCLIVLHLDAIPGIGAQGIIGTEDGIDGATGIPEVDIQSMPIGCLLLECQWRRLCRLQSQQCHERQYLVQHRGAGLSDNYGACTGLAQWNLYRFGRC